jgi:hypothetical protein
MIPAMPLMLNKWGAISPGDNPWTPAMIVERGWPAWIAANLVTAGLYFLLGLSITRGLTKLHGGTVTIESTVGQGTVVTVIMPAHRVMLPPRQCDVALARANLR